MGVSSHCTTCMNSICLFLSLPFLLAGYILKAMANSPCDPVVYKPLLAVGLSLFLLSLFGLLGSCCGCTCFLVIYLMILLVMIISVMFTLVFGVTVMKGSAGEEIAGMVYKEYHLSDFSSWLRNRLVDNSHWLDIRNCMVRHDVCGKFEAYRTVADFVLMNKTKLTPIESGCCKPPNHCGFEYDGSTQWKAPEKGITSPDPDCKTWSNDQEVLCYDCGACKAGYLAILTKSWKKLTTFNVVVLILLIVMFIFGCCALCT